MSRKLFTLGIVVLLFALVNGANAYVIGENGEIVGVSVTPSSEMAGRLAVEIINGNGMDTFGNDTHHIITSTMWLSNNANPATEWLEFDLGGAYDLTKIDIWNYNERIYAGLLPTNWTHGRGVLNMDILVAGSDHVFSNLMNVNLNEAGDGAPVFDSIAVSTTATQYVKFDINTNLASLYPSIAQEYVGLSEVQFQGELIPEPATMVLLALGSIALIRRRRA